AGTLSDDELCRRREKRPVEISCLAQELEEHAACPRFRLVWFRYAARIDQLDALAVIKTARTANHDVARHARSAHGVDQLVGVAGQEMDAADDDDVVSKHWRKIINTVGIALLRDNTVEVRHTLRMPHDGCDLMAPPRKLGKDSRSGIAGRADQSNPHRHPPAGERLSVLATSLWRR